MINRMKKIVYLPVFAALFLASCGGRGTNGPAADESTAFQKVIDVNQPRRDTVDFGRIRQGDEVDYRLGLRNTDSTAMVILEIQNTCGCTSLSYDHQPILSGDTASIRLRYDSQGQFGTQVKSMRIMTTLETRPLVVYLKAEVYKR